MPYKKRFTAITIDNALIQGQNVNGFRLSFTKVSTLIYSLFLFICAFALYANTLKNAYAIDDEEVILKNSYVQKGLAGIPAILSTPHLHGYSILPNETYRPLSLVFFAIEQHFFGLQPYIGHLMNILFFGLCVVALFQILVRLCGIDKIQIAFIATLLFCVHPIHTEVVANIKSFDALLCFFFAFVSMILFDEYSKKDENKYLMMGATAMFLSLISKEDSITFIFIVPLIFLVFKKVNKSQAFKISIATILPAIAFICLRAIILNANNNQIVNISPIQNALSASPDILSRFATTILVLGYYLKFMFAPYPLICDYSFSSIPFAHFSDAKVWFILAIYISILTIAIRRIIKYKNDLLGIGILFFIITLSLFSNLFFLIGSEMSERFTFLPSVGFCLIVAWAIDKVNKNNSLTSRILLSLICLFFIGITINRNNEWVDNYTLHLLDLKKSPENSHLNYCVGFALIDSVFNKETDATKKQEIVRDGITYLSKSVEICPSNTNAQSALGLAFLKYGQLDSAEIHLDYALQICPFDLSTMTDKSMCLFYKKDYLGAINISKTIISIDTLSAKSYSNIGICYFNLNKFDSALVYLRRSVVIAPDMPVSYPNLALVYNKIGQADSSRKYSSIAQRYYPGFVLPI